MRMRIGAACINEVTKGKDRPRKKRRPPMTRPQIDYQKRVALTYMVKGQAIGERGALDVMKRALVELEAEGLAKKIETARGPLFVPISDKRVDAEARLRELSP